MTLKNLALASTAFTALVVASPAHAAAAPATQGVMYFGFSEWLDNYDFRSGNEGFGFDYDHPSLYGSAKVNVPYDDTVNLQIDIWGDASMHDGSSKSFGDRGNFGGGFHIDDRDLNQGMLGVFAATGRVWDIYGANSSPAYMAGFEGQYYCGHWTLSGQAGYMDANGFFMQNAGFVQGLASYYASPRLKITGGVGYIDGEVEGDNAFATTWQASGEYRFGRSVPVGFMLKYEGREADVRFSSSRGRLESNAITVGFNVYLGCANDDSIERTDKTGAGAEVANFDWFRLPND